MKLRAGYVLLAFGLLALIILTVVRLGRERLFYELQLREQADSIESGLRTKWRNYLLSAAQKDKLPRDFALRWNRTGKLLLSEFYPQPGVQLEWAEYREAKKKEDINAQKAFLTKALDLHRSWDRVLAIEEWKRFNDDRPGPAPEGYEKTIVDPEARAAYKAIIEQIETGRDFTYVRPEADLDQVFFHLTGDDELEGYLPSVASVKAGLADNFASANGLSEINFGSTVLDVHFPQFQKIAAQAFKPVDSIILTASALLLAIGVGLTASGTLEQRRTLSQRVGFLNQVVHELKTPLTGLKLSAQLMAKGGASEENLNAVLQSVGRLDRLFDDIVRINRAEQKADLKIVSAEEFQGLIETLCETEFFGKAHVEGKANYSVVTELGRLRVLTRNLISNGVKYGQKVTVRIVERGGHTEITVRDEGPGVSLKDAPKIFDEFFRAEGARKMESDGLGLGLSLVKKLAKELGTQVELKNPSEKGALFLFTLTQKENV